jgi:predicted lipoprotein with Yx(FWY)xxD motif
VHTKVIAAVLVVLGLVAAGTAMALSGGSSSSKPVVKTGHAIGKKVLVTRSTGMTLYSLSAETHGRFICKDMTCMSLWHPLTVAKGTKPTGASHLATVRRPDGRTQVTFNGKPLYTFVQDKKPGQAKGEGFKDVGTWHVASLSSTTAAPRSPSSTPSYPSY